MNEVNGNGKSGNGSSRWIKLFAWGFVGWSVMLPIAIWLFDQTISKQLDRFEAVSNQMVREQEAIDRRIDILSERQNSLIQHQTILDSWNHEQDTRLAALELAEARRR